MTPPPTAKERKSLPGIYPFGGYWVARTDQGGVEQYIAVARTGRVWFVSSSPPVERVE